MLNRDDGLNVIFAGGGTGGHLYPAIAIADALVASRHSVAFIGTADRLESSIVPNAGYRLYTVAAAPLGRCLVRMFRALAANVCGVLQSVALLFRLQPDVVIATGGYVCFPVVVAARLLRALKFARAAIALLEPNVQPGLTNRLLAPLVDEIWGAYGDREPRFAGKYVPTGVPVRAALRTLPSRDTALRGFGLDADAKTLFVIGGSQGAQSLNDAAIAARAAAAWPPGWQLLLVAGARDYQRVRAALPSSDAVVEYLDDITPGYAAADLVLARAGASTLAELTAVAKPAILVPYPHASQDHQTANARRYAQGDAAVVVADAKLRYALCAVLADITQPRRLQAMRVAARARQVADPLATILARVEALTARKTYA